MYMRTIISVITATIYITVFSQENKNNVPNFTYRVCDVFSITPPLTELYKQQQVFDKNGKNFESKNRFTPHKKVNINTLPVGNDPVLQNYNGSIAGVPFIKRWPGQDGMQPPDPSGAAGPNHYVQTVNVAYTVYNKNGVVLLGPLSLTSLWPNSFDDGDAVVMYDKFADRWVITEFLLDFLNGKYAILFAVSKTPDPTGVYYTYQFNFSDFPDYPKFSIWWDGYYMSSNIFSESAAVFDRNKMLAGDSSAAMIEETYPSINANNFFCPLPADADGQLPPVGTPMYFFHLEDDNWSGVTQDAIKVYKMVVDWSTPSNSTLVLHQTLTPSSFDTDFGITWQNIIQPGTTQKLDAIAGVFMYRAPYRKWINYNSVLLNHVVDVDNTDHAGIRWYELRESAGTWSIYQEGTYAPDADNRWMGSMAMDDDGNIGIAYSVSGINVNPGLRYTGRYMNDSLGIMTVAEQIAVTGTGVQTGIERYGDYSQMSLDPDGYTFWYTGEYMSTFNSQKTEIFSFKLAGNQGIESKNLSAIDMKVYKLDSKYLKVEVNGLQGSERITIDMFDITGKIIQRTNAIAQTGSVKCNINYENISSGTYLVRIGNDNFQRVTKIVL